MKQITRAFRPLFRFPSFLYTPRIHTLLPTNRNYFSQSKLPEKLSFRDLTRKYGVTAFGVYLVLTALVFSSCYLSVVALDIDAEQIQSVAVKMKSFVGILPDPPSIEPRPDTPSFLTRTFAFLNLTSPTAQKGLTQVFVALLMTKLFSPFKFLATAMITPVVARRMKGAGLDLGTRKVRDVGVDMKKRVKGRINEQITRKKDV